MKTLNQYLPLLFVCLYLAACQPRTPLPAVKKTKSPSGLIIGNPISYYNDSTLLFPVGCDYAPTSDNLNNTTDNGLIQASMGTLAYTVSVYDVANVAPSTIAQYNNATPNNFDMRNLLFMNKYTRKSYTLCDSTMHILSFEIHKEFIKPYVIYKAAKHDTNHDSLFTTKDIVTAYLSAPDGSNFIQLTPDGESYDSYFFYPETQTILFKTYRDTNNDREISMGDESNFFEVNLRNPQQGHSIFPDSLRNKLKGYI